MEIIYSYMTEEDISKVAGLEKAAFSQPWSEGGIAHYLETGSTIFIVAKYKDDIVGYIAIMCVLDEGNIISIVVDEKYRRMGIATEILYVAIDEAKKEGIESLNLEVRKSNHPAICFYEKEGFGQVGQRKGFYDKPKEDALLLKKDL